MLHTWKDINNPRLIKNMDGSTEVECLTRLCCYPNIQRFSVKRSSTEDNDEKDLRIVI